MTCQKGGAKESGIGNFFNSTRSQVGSSIDVLLYIDNIRTLASTSTKRIMQREDSKGRNVDRELNAKIRLRCEDRRWKEKRLRTFHWP